jgi:hypothetical protein
MRAGLSSPALESKTVVKSKTQDVHMPLLYVMFVSIPQFL